MTFTILGAAGFIGARLVARLGARGIPVRTPTRAELAALEGELGHVVYAIGVTADFRQRPWDTIEAHVSLVSTLLQRIRCASFLYLSSTRVYAHSASTREDVALAVQPADPDDLYNLSKLAGEAICLGQSTSTIRVARLSNVYGLEPASQNFLPSLIRGALRTRRMVLRSAPGSAKDYIAVDAAADRLIDIALAGRHRLYNVASGMNTRAGDIAAAIGRAAGASVEVEPGAPEVTLAPIDVARLGAEFRHAPSPLLADLPDLVAAFGRELGA
jgi:nucleoside-diphosphate-sugar epimerase